MLKSNIYVFFACNSKLNERTFYKLKQIEKLSFGRAFNWIATEEAQANLQKLKEIEKISVISASSNLFDFSRYNDFLNERTETDIVIMVNDTLGKGRKFGLGLKLYISISILLINFGLINIAAPLDRDKFGVWISPYLVIGRVSCLKNLNWTSIETARESLKEGEESRIQHWLDNKWRSRTTASKTQRNIKHSVLILERNLLRSNGTRIKLFAFSKRNPLRILNSFSHS